MDGCHQREQITVKGLEKGPQKAGGCEFCGGRGRGLRIDSDEPQVGTQCLHSRRDGCLSQVGYRCKLALCGAKLALSFNLFSHHHGSPSRRWRKHAFVLNVFPTPYWVQLIRCGSPTG